MIIPKKRLGQHFLKNHRVAYKIVSLLKPDPPYPILEIGPGKGALTQFLISLYPDNPLYLFEPDAQCIDYLKKILRNNPSRYQIYQSSILNVDLASFFPSNQLYCIGNLPYNLTGPILFWLLKYRSKIKRGVFMLQEEVVKRLISSHGNRSYGAISVLFQTYFQITYQFRVSKGQFEPLPKVESAVFSIEPILPDPVPFELLYSLVKQAFASRRKILKNNVKNFPIPSSLQSLRAEEIPVSLYHEWVRSLIASNS